MGNKFSVANHDDVKDVVAHRGLLIHVMNNKQQILIHGTLSADIEEEAINNAIHKSEFAKPIVIYGKNTHCIEKLVSKQKQLTSIGFTNIKIYIGGLFEWILLQDIYGSKEFPLTGSCASIDPLLYFNEMHS